MYRRSGATLRGRKLIIILTLKQLSVTSNSASGLSHLQKHKFLLNTDKLCLQRMELTPIRNPGKYIHRENQVVMFPGKVKSGQDYSSSDRPRAPDEKIKQVSCKHAQSRHKLSSLERLPTEIVEKIFKLCLNLSLPRSSPIIGVRLANWNIYKTLILSVFETTWRKSLLSENDEGPEHRNNECEEQQTDILRCSWAVNALIVVYQRWIEENSFKPLKPIWCRFQSPS